MSGVFAIVKPSGPTSMSIINDIKQLVSNSRLFVDSAKLGPKASKTKTEKKGRRVRDAVKIGQGGTLDPLADGVLGQRRYSIRSPLDLRKFGGSGWNW